MDMQRLQRRALGDLLSLCRSRSSGLYCGTSSGLIHLTPEAISGSSIGATELPTTWFTAFRGCIRLHLAQYEQGPYTVQPPNGLLSTTMRRRISM